MERRPRLWVGWLGPRWAGPGSEQVGVHTEAVNESLSGETLKGGVRGWLVVVRGGLPSVLAEAQAHLS